MAQSISYLRGMAKKAVATTPLKTPAPVVPRQKPSVLLIIVALTEKKSSTNRLRGN
jgi:hypothetical protein